jgi:hypothetical protein
VCQDAQAEVWCHLNKHPYCSHCLDHTLRCQVWESREQFIAGGCRFICPYCPDDQTQPAFEMRQLAHRLEPATYDKFQECVTEQKVIAAKNDCAIQYKKQIEMLRQQLSERTSAVHADPDLVEVQEAAQHCTDNLILPRCPNKDCRYVLSGFDACAAIKCDAEVGCCGIYYCAWCLEQQDTKVKCHLHVQECRFNPTNNMFHFRHEHGAWWCMMVCGGVWWSDFTSDANCSRKNAGSIRQTICFHQVPILIFGTASCKSWPVKG